MNFTQVGPKLFYQVLQSLCEDQEIEMKFKGNGETQNESYHRDGEMIGYSIERPGNAEYFLHPELFATA